MERLNIQAHKNAINSSDEYVMEAMVTFEKVSATPLTLHRCPSSSTICC